MPAKDETPHVRTRSATTLPSATLLLTVLISAALGTGCGAVLRFSDDQAESISFASGELRSHEPHSITELDVACGAAIDALGYEDGRAQHEEARIVWEAQTAGGDRVEIQLMSGRGKGSELRIRVGVLGDETRSRLLLEQIHQSL